MSETHDDDRDEAAGEPLILPLDAWHRAKGARMVEFAGYAMPVQYAGEGGGIIAEHLWTRENAGLFDVSHMGQLGVAGPGGDIARAAQALEALLPGDIAGLEPGRMRYSLLLNDEGGILDDLMVLNTGKDFAIVVNGATKWDDIGHLREHLPDEITLTHFDEQALLALQGPQSAAVLARLGLAPLDGGRPLAELTFMQADIYDWNGMRLGISRSGYTGEDGFEISVASEHAAALADALCAQAEVKPIGLGARDSLRLEAGLPLYGHDLTEQIDPVSAGLAFAIGKRRRSEGGFMGADRVLALLTEGTATRRVGVALEGRMAAREGAKVLSGDREVGTVTSGGFSPSLQRPIAMAYVEAAIATPGIRLELDNRGRRLAASVVQLPFVAHRYHR